MTTSDPILLNDLLQDWHEQLCAWARTGELTLATQEALRLVGEPEQLKQLVREWSEGDFRHLPPVVLLPGSAIPGATGAYAISTGTIYLNQDLLASTSRERAIAVLTEELGHHLDALLNTIDTPGDEGHALRRFIDGTNTAHNSYNDAGTITLGHTSISAEFSRNIVASELITIKDSYLFRGRDSSLRTLVLLNH